VDVLFPTALANILCTQSEPCGKAESQQVPVSASGENRSKASAMLCSILAHRIRIRGKCLILSAVEARHVHQPAGLHVLGRPAGLTAQRSVQVGNCVSAGAALMAVVPLSEVYIERITERGPSIMTMSSALAERARQYASGKPGCNCGSNPN
jgi:hypothetical protein